MRDSAILIERRREQITYTLALRRINSWLKCMSCFWREKINKVATRESVKEIQSSKAQICNAPAHCRK